MRVVSVRQERDEDLEGRYSEFLKLEGIESRYLISEYDSQKGLRTSLIDPETGTIFLEDFR